MAALGQVMNSPSFEKSLQASLEKAISGSRGQKAVSDAVKQALMNMASGGGGGGGGGASSGGSSSGGAGGMAAQGGGGMGGGSGGS